MRTSHRGGRFERLEPRRLLSAIPIGLEFRANTYTSGAQSYPSIALSATGDFAVTWQSGNQDGSTYGVYAQRYNSAGVAQGAEFRVNTSTTGPQQFPAIAMDPGGDFVITWSGVGQGDNSDGVYAQRYDTAGVPQGDEFLVNTYTTQPQRHPAVSMDAAGDFVVVWSSYRQDGSGYGIYGQRYDATGVRKGNEFHVSTYTSDHQASPSVSMDDDGDFVVTWTSDGQDGSGSGIFAKRYNSAGAEQGEEFRVNTYTSSGQSFPSVATDTAGNFVIGWTTARNSAFSIYAQRYSASGAAEGEEFRVSTSVWLQLHPVIAMDSGGDFTVAWQGYPQEQSGYGIYAQRYNSAGCALGGELRVNTYTTNDQQEPAIAMDANGDFVVAWDSYEQDGSRNGIYVQRDAVVPVVTSSTFLFDSSPHRLRFGFNHDVRESLGTDDLLVENLTTGQTAPSDQFVLLYDPGGDVATFIYVGPGNNSIAGVLPDGRYRATVLASGISTPQGASPAADYIFDFFFVNGDGNRDGNVNLHDFNILASNFGHAGTNFNQGDFNFDGATDLADFNILASRFGQVLSPPALHAPIFGGRPIANSDENPLDELTDA
jgi:hypothetical protein